MYAYVCVCVYVMHMCVYVCFSLCIDMASVEYYNEIDCAQIQISSSHTRINLIILGLVWTLI